MSQAEEYELNFVASHSSTTEALLAKAKLHDGMPCTAEIFVEQREEILPHRHIEI